MKILLTGGGTGGHITPLLAVAHELKRQNTESRLFYVGERAGKFQYLTEQSRYLDKKIYIFAGKFRRYHGESWLNRILDLKTIFLNSRDLIFVVIGTLQAIWHVRKIRPDIIFFKGGFVGLPVGIAARLLRIPYITHDSDTVPGLANRLIGGQAKLHTTGLPAEFYSYPKDKIRFVGVPLSHDYEKVTPKLRNKYRQELRIPERAKMLFITGGSQGARNMNEIAAKVVPVLLERHNDLYIVHQVGKGNSDVYGFYKHDRLAVKEFISNMYVDSGAADIIVSRGGATQIAEYAVQSKAMVIIPHAGLTGGHQVKNAQNLEKADAAIVLAEAVLQSSPSELIDTLDSLLSSSSRRHELADNLGKMAKPDAAEQLAKLILSS